MSKFPNKVSVNTAVKHRNNFPVDFVHQTTSDFGLTQVTTIQPVVPTDVLDFNIVSRSKLLPLIKPAYGRVDLIHRAFFVPMDFICADWKSWISNHSLNDSSLVVPGLPIVSAAELYELFFAKSWVLALVRQGVMNIDSWSDYDGNFKDLYSIQFSIHGYESFTPPTDYTYKQERMFTSDLEEQSNGVDVYIKLTPLGKQVLNVFNQLGYNIGQPNSFSLNALNNDATWLPLFALTKIFTDYYVDPRYNWSEFTVFFRQFTNELWTQQTVESRALTIHDMLVLCAYGWFENDLFTSAWQGHTQAAVNGLFKSMNVTVQDTEYDEQAGNVVSVATNKNDDPLLKRSQNGALYALSEHMLDVLHAVTSYFKRNNIAGSRPIDTLLARFGVHQPELLAGRCQYLGSYRAPITIGEVVANTSGSDGVNSNILGERAGIGSINPNGSFNVHFESKFFYGFIIVVSHILPKTSYYQGIKPFVLQHDKFDFYTPEMDELGAEPLPNKVLYNDYHYGNNPTGFVANGIFGFVPRYYAYKFGFDTLSGDFRLNQFYNSLHPYCMFRDLVDPDDQDIKDLSNIADFRIFNDRKRAIYDKIFVNQSIDYDHFILLYTINGNFNRPMAGIGSSLLGKLDGGRAVGMRPNGKYF